MENNSINRESPITIINQIAENLITDIKNGIYKKDDKLLSINKFSNQKDVSRDTIERAYKILIQKGYVNSVKGKGYYVAEMPNNKIKVLLVFNTISNFQKKIYEAIVSALGKNAEVDIAVCGYSTAELVDIIKKSTGKYDYFIISPFVDINGSIKNFIETFRVIPANKIKAVEKAIIGKSYCLTFMENYDKAIYSTLKSIPNRFKKYKKVVLLFPADFDFPESIYAGFKLFCSKIKIDFAIISAFNKETELNKNMEKGIVFITLTDQDLVDVIKASNSLNRTIGMEVGIISYNDAPLKELLDITVMWPDFTGMGKAAADIILYKKPPYFKNPFNLILRKSL